MFEEFLTGIITVTQLPGNLLVEQQAKLIFARYDIDTDGFLSYPEFCHMFLP